MSTEFYNIGMYFVFFLLYIAIGVAIGVKTSSGLETYSPPTSTSDELNDITLDMNTRLITLYSREIGTFFGFVWPITLVFFLALDLGHYIYFGLIYNGNEEDRIASWLV
jgi:hypothetical protein